MPDMMAYRGTFLFSNNGRTMGCELFSDNQVEYSFYQSYISHSLLTHSSRMVVYCQQSEIFFLASFTSAFSASFRMWRVCYCFPNEWNSFFFSVEFRTQPVSPCRLTFNILSIRLRLLCGKRNIQFYIVCKDRCCITYKQHLSGKDSWRIPWDTSCQWERQNSYSHFDRIYIPCEIWTAYLKYKYLLHYAKYHANFWRGFYISEI